MPLSPSEVYNDQLIMKAKREEEKKAIESKEGKGEQKSRQKKSENQDNRNITLLGRKKELKRILLIRPSLSLDLCKDLHVHRNLKILPSHTLHSILWKEENHDLHLETFSSIGLIPSSRFPSLNFIGDSSYLSLFSLSPIEVSHLFHAFAYMLYPYDTSSHSSIFISLTCINIFSMLSLFILEVVSPFSRVCMHFFYYPHIDLLCMTTFAFYVDLLQNSFLSHTFSSMCSISLSHRDNFFSSFPIVIDFTSFLQPFDSFLSLPTSYHILVILHASNSSSLGHFAMTCILHFIVLTIDYCVLLFILIFGLYQWFIFDPGGLTSISSLISFTFLLLLNHSLCYCLFCRFKDKSFRRRRE